MGDKIGILTFHRADNYGAVLQTYATQEFFLQHGKRIEIIDYRCQKMEDQYKLFKTDSNSFKGKIKTCLHDLFRISRKKNFNQFRKKRLILSKKYSDKTIKDANKDYDIFITGSDQVWNDRCSLKDPVYCLTFAEPSKKILSVSASFGLSHLEKGREEFYKSALSRFDDISVREESGVKIVKSLTGKTPAILPDPTLMLSIEKWRSIAKAKRRKQKYILIYLLNARDNVLYFAEKLAKCLNLKIINITDDNRNPIDAELVHNAGPAEFLGLFDNAEYVITNSFHGLMFSIIFRKSMYVDIPAGNDTTYERLTNILKKLDINGRYINDLNNDFVPNKLDYAHIEDNIRLLQNKFIDFFEPYL